MDEWLGQLLELLGEWGLILTFLGSMLENIAVIGTFTPGDVIVVASSLAVRAKGGILLPVVGATVLGVMAGNNITYFIFRDGGRALLLKIGRWAQRNRLARRFIRIDEESLRGTEEFFRNHGSKAVFLARFVTGFKSYIIAVAGVSRMRIVPFQVYSLLSALIYSVLLVTIGWFVGSNLESAMSVVSRIGIVGLFIFIVFIASILFRRFNRQTVRLEELAEERHELEAESIIRGLDSVALQSYAEGSGLMIYVKDITGSTNDDVRARALSGSEEGTAVVASAQTAGRGRRGKEWVSPRGGLYFSLLLRPEKLDPQRFGLLPLLVAVGAAEGLEELGLSGAKLKWPNDLMVQNAKLGGILCESVLGQEGNRFVVCGVGINIFKPLEGPPATSGDYRSINLTDALGGKPLPSMEEIAVTLLDRIYSRYLVWVSTGDDQALIDKYEQRMLGIGRRAETQGEDPDEVHIGTIIGVDRLGRLILDDGVKKHHLTQESLSLREWNWNDRKPSVRTRTIR